jgi:cytochrome c biogenesis protein CcmG, thiol:disulfide interchange protein DsbE
MGLNFDFHLNLIKHRSLQFKLIQAICGALKEESMRVFGLVIVLTIAIGLGAIITKSRNWKSQSVPKAYQLMENLESEGIYKSQELEFESFNSGKIQLSQLKGKILILSFWATWCEPCVEEFPSFIKLLDEFPDKVVLVAISHDYKKKDVEEFVSAFKGQRKNLILTLDSEKKLSQAFGVDRLPEGFIFSGEGKLLKKIIGIQNWASPNALEFFKSL